MVLNKNGSLDTNILLRLVVEDVPEQTVLIKKLLEESRFLHVADVVIFEMVFVLQSFYEFSREDIVESVKAIIRHDKIICNRRLFELAVTMFGENKKISFVDSTLPFYASLNNALPLFTFDKELAKSSEEVQLLT